MQSSLCLEGRLELDGPFGRITADGFGEVVELRLSRLRSLPSFLRQARRARTGLLSGPPERLAGLTRGYGRLAGELKVRVGWRRWLPVEGSLTIEGFRVRATPLRFSAAHEHEMDR